MAKRIYRPAESNGADDTVKRCTNKRKKISHGGTGYTAFAEEDRGMKNEEREGVGYLPFFFFLRVAVPL